MQSKCLYTASFQLETDTQGLSFSHDPTRSLHSTAVYEPADLHMLLTAMQLPVHPLPRTAYPHALTA